MTTKTITSVGKTIDEARADLVERAGAGTPVGSIMYYVNLTAGGSRIEGPEHRDYGVAFTKALAKARVSPDEYDAEKMEPEVCARGTFKYASEERKVTKGKPSGAARICSSPSDITDLF